VHVFHADYLRHKYLPFYHVENTRIFAILRKNAKMTTLLNYIGGKLIPPVSGEYLDNYCPSTGEIYGKIPDSDRNDAELAFQAAKKAFSSWSETPAQVRSEFLMRIAALIREKLEVFARAESLDNGKPLSLARKMDIPRASQNFEFFATAILHESEHAFHTDNIALNYTKRQALGVVGCISPWNLPLYLFTWKIAPALASGNCVVAKPSEITPYTAFLLSEVCIEAGLPDGVLNIVHGLGGKIGQAIIEHPQIKAISFTGGTATGKKIAETAAPMFKKLSLELGGKNPNIIFEDCDFDEALHTSVRSSFANQGQICLCGSRIFVQRSIYEKFKNAFTEAVGKLKVGDPLETTSDLGAVVSAAHKDKILSYIELAKEEGGTVLTGGFEVKPEGRCRNGWFVAPTVIEGLHYQCRTNQEEIFGPVVTLTPFETEGEVVEMANGTSYGLAATVWTSNLKRAHRVAANLESGIVWVNCWLLRDLRTPFGGVKNSGVGREGGFEALKFFTEEKNICIKL
jgi:aminomuconate-semialdehyde/2-hydroxymuconate-6-semialdehyde dehydrogenase